ncbi:DUF2968 domain-containing protein [Dyella agri]|uniref:DUF2968 domain-containing protein n=1 Tax=Dyella agri TaxID=1926869 RepID=A0ABW8KNW7_9GAMM
MNRAIRSACARRVLAALITLALTGCSATVLATQPKPVPASTPTPTAQVVAAQQAAPGSTVAYLQQLMDSHQLTELRTTYNGTYGASLLFQADTLTYFAVLFHDKAIWRVIKTESDKSAEGLYRSFAEQTEQLAQADIDALRLQAGKTYAAKMVAANQQRLQALQEDISHQQQQAKQVALQQEQARQQAVTLSSDLRSTSSELSAIEQRIQQLKAQQDNPELRLPAAAASTAPVAGTPDAAPAGSTVDASASSH